MSLHSDVISHIWHFVSLDTLSYLSRSHLCKGFIAQIMPHLGPIILPRVTSMKSLLSLFSPYQEWPELSGTIVLDVPEEMVPWAQLRYQNLVIFGANGITEPWRLVPLLARAVRDPRLTISIHSEEMLLVEAHDGYVSNAIIYQLDIGSYHCLQLQAYKILWRSTLWLERRVITMKPLNYATHIWFIDSINMEHGNPDIFPELAYARSEREVSCNPMMWPKLVEMGPGVIYHQPEAMIENHPCLQIVNIDGQDRDMREHALNLPYRLRLTVEQPLIPCYQELYDWCDKIVEVVPHQHARL